MGTITNQNDPPFNQDGVLSPGMVDLSLADFRRLFCYTDQRRVIFQNFNYFLKRSTIYSICTEIWIDGSYVESGYWHGEADPHDVDFLMLFNQASLNDDVRREMLHYRSSDVRERLKRLYLIDPYWCEISIEDIDQFGTDYWRRKFGYSRRENAFGNIPKGIVRIMK